MAAQKSTEDNHFSAANLSTDQLDRLESLEKDLRNASEKDIVLVAYEGKENVSKEGIK